MITKTSIQTHALTTKRPGNRGVFLFLAIVVGITVYLGTHAYRSHLAEAEQTRNCVQQNGVWKVYMEPDGKTFHWFCQDPVAGTIFDLIVEKINENLYREKTAFKPKGGKWDAIQDWLYRDKRGGQFVNPPSETIQLIEP